MKYELAHDNIARQIFRKASESLRRRVRVKKYVEDKYNFYIERKNEGLLRGVGGLLTKDELMTLIEPMLGEIHFTAEETAFIKQSQKAVRSETEKELERLELLRLRQKRNLAVVSILLGLSIMTGILSMGLWQIVWQQRNHAQAGFLASKSLEAYQQHDVTEAFWLANAALQYEPENIEALQGLYRAAYQEGRQPRYYYYSTLSARFRNLQGFAIAPNDTNCVATLTPERLQLIRNDTVISTFQTKIFDDNASLAFSPDGSSTLVSTSNMFQAFNHALNRTAFNSPKRFAKLHFAEFSKDYRTMITGSERGVELWQFGREAPSLLLGGLGAASELQLSPDRKFILANFKDHLSIYDIAKKDEVYSVPIEVLGCRFIGSGHEFVVRTARGVLRYDIENPHIMGLKMPVDSDLYPNFGVDRSSNIITIYDYEANAAPKTLEEGNDFFANENGERYLVIKDSIAYLFDKQGVKLGELHGSHGNITRAVFATNHTLYTVSDDGYIKRWFLGLPAVVDLPTEKNTLGTAQLASVSNSPYYIMTQSAHGRTQLWLPWANYSSGYKINDSTSTLLSNSGRFIVWAERNNIAYYDILNPNHGQNPVLKSLSDSPIDWLKAADSTTFMATTQSGKLFVMGFRPTDYIKERVDLTTVGIKIDSARLSPDGTTMLLFAGTQTLLYIDKNHYKVLCDKPLIAVHYSADGQRILLATQLYKSEQKRNTVLLFDKKGKTLLAEQVDVYDASPEKYGFVGDTRYFTYAADNGIILRDLYQPPNKLPTFYRFIAFSPQQKYGIFCEKQDTSSENSQLNHFVISSVHSRSDVKGLVGGSVPHLPKVAYFSGSGNYFALGFETAFPIIYDKKGQHIATIHLTETGVMPPNYGQYFTQIDFKPNADDAYFVSSNIPNTPARIWYFNPKTLVARMGLYSIRPLSKAQRNAYRITLF